MQPPASALATSGPPPGPSPSIISATSNRTYLYTNLVFVSNVDLHFATTSFTGQCTTERPPRAPVCDQSPPEYKMSSMETERFLKQWAATVPLTDGSKEETLIDYEEICASVESYLESIRAENSELPVELRPSEEMQLYQARQITVLEIWGFTAHSPFPPPPEPAAATYQAAALFRINSLTAYQDGQPDNTSLLKQAAQATSPRQVSAPTTPARSPIPTRAAKKSNKPTFHKVKVRQKSPATPSAITKSPRNPATCVRRENDRLSKATASSNIQKLPSAISRPGPQIPSKKNFSTAPLSTVTGAVIYRHPVPPIWPGIKLQDGWDLLTGFPSGSFVFSTAKAFPRIVGLNTQGVGEIIGRVNEMFPLLRLRWERTPVKADGRKDLAVWVEFGFGVSHTDPVALGQKDVVLRGLQEFHCRDLASSHSYFGTYFEQNIERIRAESLATTAVTKVPAIGD
ncbi:hypothetical protein DL98DRAFT_595321 [Cadophora sp. DSE1049]|nr:hypothetical protein DL98DRAFT_595321 [Cadophora sp. DSE1049]